MVGKDDRAKDINFSLAALQEIPEQYWYIRQLGLLGRAIGTHADTQ
jgi:hypothetical protein